MHSTKKLYIKSERDKSSAAGRSASRAGKFGAGVGNLPPRPATPATATIATEEEPSTCSVRVLPLQTRTSYRANDTIEVLVRGQSAVVENKSSSSTPTLLQTAAEADTAADTAVTTAKKKKKRPLEPGGYIAAVATTDDDLLLRKHNKDNNTSNNSNHSTPPPKRKDEDDEDANDRVEVSLNDKKLNPLLPPQTRKDSLLYLKHSPTRGNVTFNQKVRVHRINQEQTTAKERNVEMSLQQEQKQAQQPRKAEQQQQQQQSSIQTNTSQQKPKSLAESPALAAILVHTPSRTKANTWLEMVQELKQEQNTSSSSSPRPNQGQQQQQHDAKSSSAPLRVSSAPLRQSPERSSLTHLQSLPAPLKRLSTEISQKLVPEAALAPNSPRTVTFKLSPPASPAPADVCSIKSLRSVSSISMDSSLYTEYSYSVASTAFDYLVDDEEDDYDVDKEPSLLEEAEEWALTRWNCAGLLLDSFME